MRLQAVLGIVVFIGIAWLISERKRQVKLQMIFTRVIVQFAVAGILLYVPLFKRFFILLNSVVLGIEAATKDDTAFVFGFIGGGSSIAPYVNVGAGALIGMGAVVIRDVAPGRVAAGNPAREITKSSYRQDGGSG